MKKKLSEDDKKISSIKLSQGQTHFVIKCGVNEFLFIHSVVRTDGFGRNLDFAELGESAYTILDSVPILIWLHFFILYSIQRTVIALH